MSRIAGSYSPSRVRILRYINEAANFGLTRDKIFKVRESLPIKIRSRRFSIPATICFAATFASVVLMDIFEALVAGTLMPELAAMLVFIAPG